MPGIAILGASGLVGDEIARRLQRDSFAVTAVARRFTRSQKAQHAAHALEAPVVELTSDALDQLLRQCDADVVVNCIGVLQDASDASGEETHARFPERLAAACRDRLLVHLSIPDPRRGDTDFSRSKADGDARLAGGEGAVAILRPGFVIAATPYGGSALLRALAATGIEPPADMAAAPFMSTAAADIAETVAVLASRWRGGETRLRVDWDVMSPERLSLAQVLAGLRTRLGGPAPWAPAPSWLMTVGAACGDLARRLGWRSPICATSVAELRRGVVGHPEIWMEQSGLTPRDLTAALAEVGAGVQDRWFARLYLWKGLAIASLATFWIATGLIALTFGLEQANSLMSGAVGSPTAGAALSVAASLADIGIGLAIGLRATSRRGLIAGLGLTAVYLVAGTVAAPALWLDALGPYVKDIPLVIAMLAVLAILDDR